MKQCWKFDPRERPTFAQIVGILLRHSEDGALNFPDDEFREVTLSTCVFVSLLSIHAS